LNQATVSMRSEVHEIMTAYSSELEDDSRMQLGMGI